MKIRLNLTPLILKMDLSKLDVGESTGHEWVKPLYTDGIFHCYVLEKSICHFRRVAQKSKKLTSLLKMHSEGTSIY